MSAQSYILGIVYLLSFIAGIVLAIIRKEVTPWYLAWSFISFLLISLLIYDTHCLTSVYPCTVWSWIRTGLYVILPILSLIFWGYNIKHKDDEVKLEWDVAPDSMPASVPPSVAPSVPRSVPPSVAPSVPPSVPVLITSIPQPVMSLSSMPASLNV